MRGGALPPILLCAALGFALSFASRRILLPCLILLAIVATAVFAVGFSPVKTDAIFYACWGSIVVTSACVHMPRQLPNAVALLLAVNTGLWAGAVTAVSGTKFDLAMALPVALACIPGAWLVATGRAIVLKVLASWLIAIAVLAASIPITTATPGYMPDHME